MSKNFVLLTATIQPVQGQTQLVVTDPKVRFNEYRKALAFYVGQLRKGNVDGLIFAENSLFDLATLKDQFPDPQIEWISTYGLDYDPGFHRGYGEFKLIDHVHQNSRLLLGADPTDRVWKITGRYILKNLGTVVRKAPQTFDLYGEITRTWAEMSVLAWSVQGYARYLLPIWPHFTSDAAPELTMATRLNNLGSPEPGIVSQMVVPTYLVGKRGTSGTSFQGRFGPLKHLLKVFQHWLRRRSHSPRD